MRKVASLFILILMTTQLCSQTIQKLVYPVMPIADECHLALDLKDSITIISKEDFMDLDRLWSTYNTCNEYIDDTAFASSFQVVFFNVLGEPTGLFMVSDGHLQNENQTSLNDQRLRITSHQRINIQHIRFKRDGAIHQVPNIDFVIDSLINPILLPCWQPFPMEPKNEIKITKEHLNALLNDSFGWNTCVNKNQWLEDFHTAEMTIYKSLLNNKREDYQITKTSELAQGKEAVKKLELGDYIHFNISQYQKDGKHYYTKEYRFRLIATTPCPHSVNIETTKRDSLLYILQSLNKSSAKTCLVNRNNELVNFSFTHSSQNNEVKVVNSKDGIITSTMLEYFSNTKQGDRIQIEKIKVPRTNEAIKPVTLKIP